MRAIIGAHKDIQRIENNWFAKGFKLPQGYGMIFLIDALTVSEPGRGSCTKTEISVSHYATEKEQLIFAARTRCLVRNK